MPLSVGSQLNASKLEFVLVVKTMAAVGDALWCVWMCVCCISTGGDLPLKCVACDNGILANNILLSDHCPCPKLWFLTVY